MLNLCYILIFMLNLCDSQSFYLVIGSNLIWTPYYVQTTQAIVDTLSNQGYFWIRFPLLSFLWSTLKR